MTFTSFAWPKSDLEMLEQTVDDYITQDRFHAYYMTFSGHMRYDVNANTGEIRYLVDGSTLPENYVENLIRTVETKFSVSADILNKTYYKFVFREGAEAVASRTQPTEAP